VAVFDEFRSFQEPAAAVALLIILRDIVNLSPDSIASDLFERAVQL
jgi:hypothetical protein